MTPISVLVRIIIVSLVVIIPPLGASSADSR